MKSVWDFVIEIGCLNEMHGGGPQIFCQAVEEPLAMQV